MASKYEGMNGTDMDTSESRKRPLDTESENGVTKRSNQGAANHHEYQPDPEEMNTPQLQPSMATDLGDNVHLKILVPSIAAGAIIGKGGETIAHVQKEAGARVKMSKANDFYPGTTERVCLIMGAADSVRKVNTFIMEKIREKPDPNPKPEVTKTNFERHRQVTVITVKILVPNSTAGMIIGKAGNFIKQIKEESGAYVQISQKSKETNLPERCITVAGDLECNRKAVDMIVQKIVEDPQSGSCPNISYADYTGPVASANPTGSPFANSAFMQSTSQEMTGVNNNNFAGGAFGFGFQGLGNSIGGGIANLNLNSMLGGANGAMSPQAMDNLRMTLRNSGYSDQATEDISTAMNTLASYGVLGVGLGAGGGNVQQSPQASGYNIGSSMSGPPPPQQATPQQQPHTQGYMMNTPTSTGPGSLFGPVGSGSSGLGNSGSTGANSSLFGNTSPSVQAERYGSSPMLNDSYTGPPGYTSTPTFPPQPPQQQQQQQQMPPPDDRSPSINVNQNSFGLGTGMYSPTDDKGAPTKQDLEVSETIVGAILGPGGKGIVELQQYTQTNIQISKKGVYVPGTRNRIVTITGTPQNIAKAQHLIQQRIQHEEIKRARQAQTR